MITINWTNFIQTELPRNLRTVINFQWLMFLLAPAIRIYNELVDFFNDVRYRMSFNGQVMYLEKLLNTVFDPSDEQIFIEDGPITETYIFNENELNEETYLYNEVESPESEVYLYNEDESLGDEVGFVIHVPAALDVNEPQLMALVNGYKLAGMSYSINYF
jgi:hypothetical protein